MRVTDANQFSYTWQSVQKLILTTPVEKISISKTPSVLSLVDWAVPAHGNCAGKVAVRIERKIDAAAAEGVRRLSVVNGWSSDTVYAAAWMVVRDLVLGMSEVTLHEHDEKWPDPAVATSIHRLSPDAISRDWITQFEHDRQLVQPRQGTTFVEDIDHIWLKRRDDFASVVSCAEPV